MLLNMGGSPIGPWGYSNSSNSVVRPASSNTGLIITCGNNTMGTYRRLLDPIPYNCYGIAVLFDTGDVSTAAKNMIMDIGIDPAGADSYTVLLPYLLASCADRVALSGGIRYYFPVFIPAGATIGCRGSVNNATHLGVSVRIWIYGKPHFPDKITYGQGVTAFGVTTGTSSGTAVTSGTTSEGSWTQLGSTTQRDYFWWQCGFGINDSTMNALLYYMDLAYGDASNKIIIAEDIPVMSLGTTEKLAKPHISVNTSYKLVPRGSLIYGRLQCSGTADASLSMIAYGVY